MAVLCCIYLHISCLQPLVPAVQEILSKEWYCKGWKWDPPCKGRLRDDWKCFSFSSYIGQTCSSGCQPCRERRWLKMNCSTRNECLSIKLNQCFTEGCDAANPEFDTVNRFPIIFHLRTWRIIHSLSEFNKNLFKVNFTKIGKIYWKS